MGAQEIGQLQNGWGLSGAQLERYQEQRTNDIKKKVKHDTCKADQKKAKSTFEDIKLKFQKGWDTYVTMQQKADDMTIPVGDAPDVLSNIQYQ